jgi:hypothetical protein
MLDIRADIVAPENTRAPDGRISTIQPSGDSATDLIY